MSQDAEAYGKKCRTKMHGPKKMQSKSAGAKNNRADMQNKNARARGQKYKGSNMLRKPGGKHTKKMKRNHAEILKNVDCRCKKNIAKRRAAMHSKII